MSDMKVGLSVRATGKQAQRELKRTADATDHLGQSAKDVGTAAAGAGAKVKKAAREQAQAVRQSAKRTTEALAEIKRSGREAGQAIRQGMRDGVRAERAAGRETDRLGSAFSRMIRRVGGVGGAFRSMGRAVRAEVKGIKHALDSTQGKLAALGISFAVGHQVIESAQLDRTLIRTQQTAGMTIAQRDAWREELFGMARKNGNPVEALQRAFDTLIASGLSPKAAQAGTKAIDRAMTVTGADPGILAKALVAGASAYNIDLSQPGKAVALLDKMIVAGRLGNAELENLSSIFPKIGSRASQIGMPFEQTLAFAETLSNVELDPARLGTLAESTLRLFGNRKYAVQVSKATGVRFFDNAGKRRNVLDIFSDLRKQYNALDTDQKKAAWLGKVLKGTDLDTQRGFGVFLSGNKLEQFRSNWRGIQHAKGVMDRDIAENRDTATAVAGRVKATFGQVMDEMARPINKAFAEAGDYMLDHFSGKEMLAGGAAALLAAPLAAKLGKGVLGKLLGGAANAAGTVRGIAVGHALQEATGTVPVFVTNWGGAAGVMGGGGLLSGAGAGAGRAAEKVAARRALVGGAAAETTAARKLIGLREIGYVAVGVAAIKGINAAFKPLADKEHAWEQRKWRDDAKRRLGMNDAQLDAYRMVKRQHPYGVWLDKREGKYSWWDKLKGTALDDYQAWVKTQAAQLGDEGTDPQMTQAARDAAKALQSASDSLERVTGQPLRIEVTSDTPEIHAHVVEKAEREARRG